MVVDSVVAALVFFGLLGGWLRGMLYQLGQVVVLVVAFIAGRVIGHYVTPLLVDVGLGTQISGLIAFGIVFIVVFIIGSWMLWRFTKMMRDASKTLGRADRVIGVVLGGAKSLLYAYMLVVALIMIHRSGTSLPIDYANSISGRWVAQNNFLDSDDFPRAKALVQLGLVLSRKDTKDLALDPEFQAIILHPKAAPLRSPEVVKALVAQDWLFLVEQEAFWDLLGEPDIQKHLNTLEARSSGKTTPSSSPERSKKEAPRKAQQDAR